MTTKQFSSQSSATGAVKMYTSVAWLILLLFLYIPYANAFAEEDTANMRCYKYEDFISFLGLSEDESADASLHTINVANCRDLNISVHSLLEAFPMCVLDREVQENAGNVRYVAYDLQEGRRLFVFVDNNVLTNVCRMEPRCTVDEFSIIPKGGSPNDVVDVDKNAVFNPFIQWGPVSYHCLSDGTYYMIKYKQSSYLLEEFSVDSIEAISKDECLSVLGTLSPDDMP